MFQLPTSCSGCSEVLLPLPTFAKGTSPIQYIVFKVACCFFISLASAFSLLGPGMQAVSREWNDLHTLGQLLRRVSTIVRPQSGYLWHVQGLILQVLVAHVSQFFFERWATKHGGNLFGFFCSMACAELSALFVVLSPLESILCCVA